MDSKATDKTGVNAMTFRGLFRIKSLDSILEDAEKIVLALALVLLITIYLTLVYMQHR